jgi:hypothetical protein
MVSARKNFFPKERNVKCMVSARTNFFPKERNVTQQQNIRLGKYVAVGEIK